MSDFPRRIGISGMHGKSTCTSISAQIFMDADGDPTVLSGAVLPSMGGAYRIGGRDNFIFEACEYKDSFLCFFPTVSVVLGIDLDHTDYFTEGLAQIKRSFTRYANIPFESDSALPFSVMCADDANVREILPSVQDAVTFGIHENANYRAVNISENRGRFSFDILKDGEFLTHIALSVVGFHNIYNALASAAVGDRLGLSAEEISAGLGSFVGLRRRFEYKGCVNGAEVYIDYAHHPRELSATLAGAKKMTEGRLICFFEPHTYSRTASLFNEFASAFTDADMTYFLDIYAAREVNTSGVTSEKLALATPNGYYAKSYGEAVSIIREIVREGDTVMILGAGTVDKIADILFDC
jgi:UDP-N-acetylmuramate--alanine ligase